MDQSMTEISHDIEITTKTAVNNMIEIWKTVFTPSMCVANMEKLKNHVREFYISMEAESLEKKEELKKEIASTESEIEALKILLDEDFGPKASEREMLPLIDVQEMLDDYLEEYRECLHNREETITKLCLEQKALCGQLGETLQPKPQPRKTCVKEFIVHLEKLRNECAARKQKITQMRYHIRDFLNTLDMQNVIDKEVLLSVQHTKLDMTTITGLQEMHRYYREQVLKLRDDINQIKEKLERCWDFLQISFDVREQVNMKCEGCTQSTFITLRNELERCLAIKLTNIEFFVKEVREQILIWWDKTYKSTEERNQFSNYTSKEYTEELLTEHEAELEKLQQFYHANKSIFDLYETRQQFWKRLEDLDASANDPKRYNNRGGQLLLEEKDRNMLSKKLPKIELEINDLVQKFEEVNHKNFLIYGENIVDVMTKDWENKRNAKEKLTWISNIKKSPSRNLRSTPSPICTKKLTPAPKIGVRRVSPTPSTSNKAQITFKRRKFNDTEKTNATARRSFLYPANNPLGIPIVRSPRKSPAKSNRIKGITICQRPGRFSTSKKRRSKEKENQMPPEIVVTEHDKVNGDEYKYETFKNEITFKNRSTEGMPNAGFKKVRTDAADEIRSHSKSEQPLNTLFVNMNRNYCSPINNANGFKLKNSPIIF